MFSNYRSYYNKEPEQRCNITIDWLIDWLIDW
jgi:hypothetical protein